MHTQPFDLYEFDIDVDISPLLEDVTTPTLVRDTWYRLAAPKAERRPQVQVAADRMLNNTLLQAQWAARERRVFDRRRAVRVPLLSRLTIDGGPHMTTTDISLSGLQASGEPVAPLMDVEFRIPGLQFPVESRVEVVSYKPANVIPLVGLRFVNMQQGYAELIARYIATRRARQLTVPPRAAAMPKAA